MSALFRSILVLLFTATLSLSGCGYKGDLYLPDEKGAAKAPSLKQQLVGPKSPEAEKAAIKQAISDAIDDEDEPETLRDPDVFEIEVESIKDDFEDQIKAIGDELPEAQPAPEEKKKPAPAATPAP